MRINMIKADARPHQTRQTAAAGRAKGGETLVVFSKSIQGSGAKNKKETGSKNQKEADSKVHLTHPGVEQRFAAAIEAKSITGRLSEIILFRESQFENFRHVLVVGLGKEKDLNCETVRKAGASVFEGLSQMQSLEASIDFEQLNILSEDKEDVLKAFVEGLLLAEYSFDELKTKKSEKKEISIHILSELAGDSLFKQAFKDALITAECVNFARRLGDMPGNLMTPAILAQEAVKAAKGTGAKVTVWDKARIKKERMGGLLGVAAGSSQEPKFIIMEYQGAAKTQKPLVIVGKGLTFDCGGISIKPSAGMEEMKYDMCGGANVIGAFLAITRLKLKINVIALIPSTENMTGPSATKPGDVHTARNGKTFEVNNTDAEGRLILADALSYASELKPQAIIDAATLTGAMVIALGNIHTGFFTRHSGLRERIEGAAESSGELVWNMPLTDEHVKDMKGTFADLSNISNGKGAGSATAAGFLEQFVGEGIPWAHFDIAGTGWSAGNRLNYCPKKGASGAIVRTFVEIARSFE